MAFADSIDVHAHFVPFLDFTHFRETPGHEHGLDSMPVMQLRSQYFIS